MVATDKRDNAISIRKLAVLTAALVPVAMAIVLLSFWLYDHIAGWVYWEIALFFLIAAKLIYWALVVLVVIGIPVLGFLLSRGLRPWRRPSVLRGLLLGASLILGLILAELASAVWKYHFQIQNALTAARGPTDSPAAPVPIATQAPASELPLPTTFSDRKRDGEIHLVVLGESSAEGVPYNFWVSIGRIVSWQLERLLPGRPIFLSTLAFSGQTLEEQHRRLTELERRPDVMIIYCGHNEFSARFNAASAGDDYYLDSRLPSLASTLGDQIRRLSPLTALLDETADKCRIAIPPSIDGNRNLVDVPVYTRAQSTALQNDFHRRLEAIVAYAERIKALPILIAPPANDAGFEPNRSFLPPATSVREREAFRRDFLAARALESSDPKHSLEQYRKLLSLQPDFAETHYRIAQLMERSANWGEAYDHFARARDLDGFPMRLPSSFQKAYHEVAEHHDCVLIDGQAYFHAIGRHGLLDENLFHDHIHPSLRGQIALAQAILHALCKKKAFGLRGKSVAPVVDPGECVKQFGIDTKAWRRLCLWGIMVSGATAGARYDPATRLQKKLEFATAANRIEAGEAPESVGLPNIGVPAPVPLVDLP